jgi:hypothetical protein
MSGPKQMYKNIPLEFIHRDDYHNKQARRYAINGTNQNLWIPTKHLSNSKIKEGEDLDYVFVRSVRQLAIAGINHIGHLYDDHFKLIIAGGRGFNDYELLKRKCDKILAKIKRPITIISGTASGADKMGERYAKERGHNLVLMPADWKGPKKKGAGYQRNSDMADVADACVTFWDGRSPGTKMMIDLAKRKGLKLRVIRYDQY